MNSVKKSPTPDSTKPSIGVRLRSWRWWVYGDMNSPPREKPPKEFYFHLVFGLFLWIFIAVHPWLSTWMNRHPPEFSSLESVRGAVVHTSRKSPHLGLKLDDGRILDMEYPGFLNTYGSSPGGTKGLGHDNEKVLGCVATVWFDVPKYTLWQRYRIWQIVCDNKQAGATYSELVAESWMDLTLRALVAFFVIPLGVGIWSIRYLRKYYER